MKVILREDVDKLGKNNDTVNVSEGYARNFLIPRGLAYEASAGNLRLIAEQNKQKESRRLKEKNEAQALANKLAHLSCTIVMNAGPDDKLFGAVTAQEIAKVLQQENISIDRKNICLEDPIKELGVFQVPVKVHPEITQNLKVWIVKK